VVPTAGLTAEQAKHRQQIADVWITYWEDLVRADAAAPDQR
jgi:hypothetical protein